MSIAQTDSNHFELSISEVQQAIRMFGGNNTIMLEGTPGIGKSSVLKGLASQEQGVDQAGAITLSGQRYLPAYIDCSVLDLGDLAMPIVDKERMITNYAPNARFRLHERDAYGNRLPIAIMLDELGKSSPAVLNMLLPLLLEHRLGDVTCPEGSIIFATTNLKSDNVGDRIPAHARSRITTVRMRAPNVSEWQEWAQNNQIAHELIALVEMHPDMLQQYTAFAAGEAKSNPYIYNPATTGDNPYCCPRSLAKCSDFVKAYREGMLDGGGDESQRVMRGGRMFNALVSGTVGRAAALELQTLVDIGAKLPTKQQILKDPKGVLREMETRGVGVDAYHLIASGLACDIQSAEELDSIAKFILEVPHGEARFLYAHLMLKTKHRQQELTQWRRKSAAQAQLTDEMYAALGN